MVAASCRVRPVHREGEVAVVGIKGDRGHARATIVWSLSLWRSASFPFVTDSTLRSCPCLHRSCVYLGWFRDSASLGALCLLYSFGGKVFR
jgi:hypothetical protein